MPGRNQRKVKGLEYVVKSSKAENFVDLLPLAWPNPKTVLPVWGKPRDKTWVLYTRCAWWGLTEHISYESLSVLNSESQIGLERQLRRQDADSRPRHYCENSGSCLSSKAVRMSRQENWWQNRVVWKIHSAHSWVSIISHSGGRRKEDRRETKYSEFHFLFS